MTSKQLYAGYQRDEELLREIYNAMVLSMVDESTIKTAQRELEKSICLKKLFQSIIQRNYY